MKEVASERLADDTMMFARFRIASCSHARMASGSPVRKAGRRSSTLLGEREMEAAPPSAGFALLTTTVGKPSMRIRAEPPFATLAALAILRKASIAVSGRPKPTAARRRLLSARRSKTSPAACRCTSVASVASSRSSSGPSPRSSASSSGAKADRSSLLKSAGVAKSTAFATSGEKRSTSSWRVG